MITEDMLLIMEKANQIFVRTHVISAVPSKLSRTKFKMAKNDPDATQFLSVISNFKILKFGQIFINKGKLDNRDLEYIGVKYLYWTILVIYREERGLTKHYQFRNPNIGVFHRNRIL